MTELQIGLIGLGASAVVGVFAFNKWQEFRHRKLAEQVMQRTHDDVLLGADRTAPVPESVPPAKPGVPEMPPVRQEPEIRIETVSEPVHERREPVLSETIAALEPDEPVLTEVLDEAKSEPRIQSQAESVVAPATAEVEPVSAPPRPASVAAPLPVPNAPLPDLLDPRLELIAVLELVEPVRAGLVMASQRDVLQRVTRPIHWLGFNESTREWERLKPESDLALRHFRIGLQLVNRLGPVSDADLALFVGAMQAIADEQMAVLDMPSPRVQERAAELDRFSAEVDLEIGINLVSKGVPFSGTKVRALAEAAGMVLGADGMFTRYDDDGRAQFSLQNMESTLFSAESIRNLNTHGLTFLLDVPRVAHGERVFLQMIELCKRFGETLQGVLVDDNRVPLGDPQIDHILR